MCAGVVLPPAHGTLWRTPESGIWSDIPNIMVRNIERIRQSRARWVADRLRSRSRKMRELGLERFQKLRVGLLRIGPTARSGQVRSGTRESGRHYARRASLVDSCQPTQAAGMHSPVAKHRGEARRQRSEHPGASREVRSEDGGLSSDLMKREVRGLEGQATALEEPRRKCTEWVSPGAVLYRASDRALTGSNGRAWGPGHGASLLGASAEGKDGGGAQSSSGLCSPALCLLELDGLTTSSALTVRDSITGANRSVHSHIDDDVRSRPEALRQPDAVAIDARLPHIELRGSQPVVSRTCLSTRRLPSRCHILGLAVAHAWT